MLGIGAALVLLAMVVYLVARLPRHKAPATAAEIAAPAAPGELQLQGMQLIAGADDDLYYLDGTVTNTGPHSITGIMADLKLRDVENKVVLDVQRPLEGMAMKDRNLVPDPLAQDPIKPNATRPVRLVLNNFRATGTIICRKYKSFP